MKTLKCLLNVACAIAALIAAALWYKSSVATAKNDEEERDEHGMMPFRISEGDVDILKTAKEQCKWSRRAALAAFASALFQAVSILIPDSN